jgi:hypothetical protein
MPSSPCARCMTASGLARRRDRSCAKVVMRFL